MFALKISWFGLRSTVFAGALGVSLMSQNVLFIVEGAHPPDHILDRFAGKSVRTEVLDVKDLREDQALTLHMLDRFDTAIAVVTSAPTQVFRRFVDCARQHLPVWTFAGEGYAALPGTRMLSQQDQSQIPAQFDTTTRTKVEDAPRRRLFGINWAVAGLGLIACLGAVLFVSQIWEELSAKRAVASPELAELDAYLETWDDGHNRERVARERVSRVALSIPDLASISEGATAPAPEERAWVEFDEADWSRLPAIVLLRIATEKHGMPAIAAAAQEGDGAAAHLMATAFLFGAFFFEPDAELAQKLFGASCAVGLQRGCFNVGYELSYFRTDADDHARGYEVIVDSCASGIEIACLNVALLIETRGQHLYPGQTKDGFLREGCEDGSPYLCAWLGKSLFDKTDATRSEEVEALALLKDGCDISDAVACFHLAQAYDANGTTEADKRRALNLFVVGCNGGLSDSCAHASEAYFNGEGTRPDIGKMVVYAEKACTYGASNGCFRLGYEYSEGQTLTRDLDRAEIYYRHACLRRSSVACYNLGLGFRNGRYGPENTHKALALFEEACDLFHRVGCALMGDELVKQDMPDRGVEVLRGSCDQDEKWGCLYLGEALVGGATGSVDLEGARVAFEKTLTLDPDSTRARTALSRIIETTE